MNPKNSWVLKNGERSREEWRVCGYLGNKRFLRENGKKEEYN